MSRRSFRSCATCLSRRSPPRPPTISFACSGSTVMCIERLFRLPAAVLLLAVSLSALAQPLLDDLIAAVANDRADEVKALLARGMDPDSVDANGETLSCIAARNGSARTVAVLAVAKANLNRPNAFGDTPLML